jgi:hypothetical protein
MSTFSEAKTRTFPLAIPLRLCMLGPETEQTYPVTSHGTPDTPAAGALEGS